MNIAFFLKPKVSVSFLYSDYTIRQALEKMRHCGYSAIPVINRDGRYVGVVSDGDFLRWLQVLTAFTFCTFALITFVPVTFACFLLLLPPLWLPFWPKQLSSLVEILAGAFSLVLPTLIPVPTPNTDHTVGRVTQLKSYYSVCAFLSSFY